MNNKIGRNESEHYVDYSKLIDLKNELSSSLDKDINSVNGNTYTVRSLIFNTKDTNKGKINRLDDNEVFTIKIYNNDYSLIKVEKKYKKNNLLFKDYTYITLKECKKIMNNDINFLKSLGSTLLFELYTKIYFQKLSPYKVIESTREAYEGDSLRVSLDYNIKTSYDINDFLIDDFKTVKTPHYALLKVKYDDILPSIIKQYVNISNRKDKNTIKSLVVGFN